MSDAPKPYIKRIIEELHCPTCGQVARFDHDIDLTGAPPETAASVIGYARQNIHRQQGEWTQAHKCPGRPT